MSVPEQKSGFRPVGEAEVVAQNPWFRTMCQPMDFVDPATGRVKGRAADGGSMNYVDIEEPGVLVVTNLGGLGTVLVQQERYPTNLVEKRTVAHYELPGGGITSGSPDRRRNPDEDEIIAAAQQELEQEIGLKAGKIILIGSRYRGLMAHPSVTDHNYTAIALDVEPAEGGPKPEVSEIILGSGEPFTWAQTREMSLNPDGLWVPEASEHKVISSAPTVAALSLAHAYLEQREGLSPVTIPLSYPLS